MSQPSMKAAAKVEKDQDSPEAAIGRLLKNMHQSTRQAIDEALRHEHSELSFAHFVTLYALVSEPGVAGAELARRSFVTAQTMNTILRRLEKDGAIVRRPNPANQRADSWSTTRTGEQRLEKARVVVERVWAQVFDALKPSEVVQLQKLLERCLVGFERQVLGSRAAKAPKSVAMKSVAPKGVAPKGVAPKSAARKKSLSRE